MGELASAKLEFVRSKIHNKHAAFRTKNPDGFHDGGFRIFEVVQNLMENCEIESLRRGLGKRQTVNVTEPDLTMPRADAFQAVARDRQHVGTDIDSRTVPDARREQFKDASGAGSGIEYGIVR